MTEIERIKKEGWLPSEFWLPETKCDFLVDEERKKLWAVSLDMFKKFIQVCEKHGLRYYAIFGTALGAVRHQGFIPWDDDIDVAMPREDYEKMKGLACEFQDPYFLQTPETDSECGYSVMKIRNSRTTYFVEKFQHCDYNSGVFFSIFPLDKTYESDYKERRKSIKGLILANSAAMRINNPDLTDHDREIIDRYYNKELSTADVFNKMENLAKRNQNDDCGHLAVLVCTIDPDEKNIWPSSVFDEYCLMPFEGMSIRVPKEYDRLLQINYGNYMEFPPVEDRGKWHDGVWDTDIPYKEYIKMKHQQ